MRHAGAAMPRAEKTGSIEEAAKFQQKRSLGTIVGVWHHICCPRFVSDIDRRALMSLSRSRTMDRITSTRRNVLAGAAIGAAAVAMSARSGPASAAAIGGVNAIPELAPQWKKLNLAKVLALPAAYMSVSQSKSLYDEGGAQSAEKHRERGSLPATIKVVQQARKAKNFISFNWIGYTIFRENYPQSEFDKVQYETWTSGLNFSPEKKKWDDELVEELQALVRPADNQFNEMALQTAFVGTQLPLELSRKSIKVIVLTGIHLDWCIEGNARAARDNGYLPIVIGDACGCQKPEQEAAAMERINNFFAPVISADTFVKLLGQNA
jgi:nicotinamidase-related amidase